MGEVKYSRTAQHGEFSDGSEGGEGMEEEQQSLAQIEKAGEREILRVPACHMVSSQATAQLIHTCTNGEVSTEKKAYHTVQKKYM